MNRTQLKQHSSLTHQPPQSSHDRWYALIQSNSPLRRSIHTSTFFEESDFHLHIGDLDFWKDDLGPMEDELIDYCDEWEPL